MKNILLLLCLTLFSLKLFSQTPERHANVKISLVGKSMADLVHTGIETEHGTYFPGRSITTVLSETEILKVQQAGFQTDILIPDLYQHYLEQCAKAPSVADRGLDCNASQAPFPNYVTPANYSYGTMGGYLTYDQMMAELDKMRNLYPNLIAVRNVTSDTILSWDGNPIYNVKISDNPDVDEAERKVLYTALHHAREPNSASQLIFYMWYLLENYDTRPDIQAIVNNLELYFVPCINVDGYKYNESTNPNGGGFWRKNRRVNGSGVFGVDLNRNYGHFWGDFGGSSPDSTSAIYRGPSAFSEPESRTMRDFCRKHDFLFVYNYHTHGNLLIYPWAYSDSPADSAFIKYGAHFTQENHYRYGTTTETVGYNVNGSSDDWMYAETGAYSFTPEVGKTGFWPTPGEIDMLNKENLWQNLTMAYSALRYGTSKDIGAEKLYGKNGNIEIEFMRYGLLDGPVNVSLSPFSSNISSVAQSTAFNLANLEKSVQAFSYQLDANTQTGESVVFLLKTDNGLWVKTDTLRKTFGGNFVLTPGIAFQDELNNFANWSGEWAITGETFHSPSTCMTDSPDTDYLPNTYTSCLLTSGAIIPANAINANLRFFAKWDIEPNWDYVQVIGTGQNNFSAPLCGLYTNTGINVQADGPIFDGVQGDWVEECMDISAFIGQTPIISFHLGADGEVQGDGFYFDDIRIEYTSATSGTHTIGLSNFQLLQNEPNPSSSHTLIQWESQNESMGSNANLLVFNSLGELVVEHSVNLRTQKSINIDTKKLMPGVYSYLLRAEHGQSKTMKMSVLR